MHSALKGIPLLGFVCLVLATSAPAFAQTTRIGPRQVSRAQRIPDICDSFALSSFPKGLLSSRSNLTSQQPNHNMLGRSQRLLQLSS